MRNWIGSPPAENEWNLWWGLKQGTRGRAYRPIRTSTCGRPRSFAAFIRDTDIGYTEAQNAVQQSHTCAGRMHCSCMCKTCIYVCNTHTRATHTHTHTHTQKVSSSAFCIWKLLREKWLLPAWAGNIFQAVEASLLLGAGPHPGTLWLHSCLTAFKRSIWCPSTIVSPLKTLLFHQGRKAI